LRSGRFFRQKNGHYRGDAEDAEEDAEKTSLNGFSTVKKWKMVGRKRLTYRAGIAEERTP